MGLLCCLCGCLILSEQLLQILRPAGLLKALGPGAGEGGRRQPWSVAKKQTQNLNTRISSPVTKEAGRKSLEIQRLVTERTAEALWRH